jgi:hypothetical protein
MFDRQLLTYFDWGLFTLIVLISGIGIVVLYSALNGGQPAQVPHCFTVSSSGWVLDFVLCA